MLVAREKKGGLLYVTKNSIDNTDIAATTNNADLWHRWPSHIGEKGMKGFYSKGKEPGLKSIKVVLCEDCVFEKHKRLSFSKANRAVKPKKLELVHNDLWGASTGDVSW